MTRNADTKNDSKSNEISAQKFGNELVLGFNLSRDVGKITHKKKSLVVAECWRAFVNDKGEKINVSIMAWKALPKAEVDMYV